MIRLQELGFAYPGRNTPILDGLCLHVRPGEMVALLGPNGSGKSTLLGLASGFLQPGSGQVLLDGRPLGTLSAKQRARIAAIMPQRAVEPPGFLVRDYVLLGRFAHTPFSGTFSLADREAADRAMSLTRADVLAERVVTSLSGGEFQRVLLARALAQSRRCLLLDEVTTGLDPQYAVRLFHLLSQLNKTEGTTILAAVHDLNLAAQFCDRLVVLAQGKVLADGATEEVFTASILENAYGAAFHVLPHPKTGKPQALPDPLPGSLPLSESV